MQTEDFVDFYETLQISPNADSDTLHRVYRILAQRYHPDNQDTGNAEEFRQITQAYATLGDPTLRAAYDVKHKNARRLSWKIFDQANAAQGVEAERRKREGVLAVLYRKRVCQPEAPTMSLKELEDLLGIPKEHLEFTLWYLKEGHFAARADNGRITITMKGVELAEELSQKSSGSSKTDWKGLIASGRVA